MAPLSDDKIKRFTKEQLVERIGRRSDVARKMALEWVRDDLLPEHMHDGMQLYVERGIDPGGFMMAVLCNDLRGACERADEINRHKIFNIVAFLYNCVPAGCWGSPEKVQDWIDKGGIQLDE